MDPVPWRALTYRPVWSERKKARIWKVGFWFLLALILFAAIRLFTPHEYRTLGAVVYWLATAGLVAARALRRRSADRNVGADESAHPDEAPAHASDGEIAAKDGLMAEPAGERLSPDLRNPF